LHRSKNYKFVKSFQLSIQNIAYKHLISPSTDFFKERALEIDIVASFSILTNKDFDQRLVDDLIRQFLQSLTRNLKEKLTTSERRWFAKKY
jgi:hypothetical protein